METISTSDAHTVLDNNLSALKAEYPDLAQKILSTGASPSNFIIPPLKKGMLPNIVMDNNGEKVLYYDAEDPLEQTRYYIESLNLKYAPILVFMGFGLGYQAITVLKELSDQLKIEDIFIIEKDIALFKTALSHIDISQLIQHPRIRFYIGHDADQLYNQFLECFIANPKMSRHFKCLKIITMPANHRINGTYYQKVMNALRACIQNLMQGLGNDPYDMLIGIEHTLKNLKPMLADPPMVSFKNLFQKKPAILVGAGPSLNKNLRFLKTASDKALILCVDAAFKPLLSAGIRPHIVTSIERTSGIIDVYTHLKDVEDIFLIFCLLCDPKLYQIYPGPKIIASRYYELSNWLSIDPGTLSGSPLVGNFAFNILEYLGCDPIIMVGQDLSFKPTGSTHVDGMIFDISDFYRKGMSEVESNYGEKLMTNPMFAQSKAELENQIANYPGICVNATEGGARINGALLLDLKSSLNTYCNESFNYPDHLKQHWQSSKPGSVNLKNEFKRIVRVLDKTLSDLDEMAMDCQKGCEIIESFKTDHELIKNEKPNPDILPSIQTTKWELNRLRDKIFSITSMGHLLKVFQCIHTTFEMNQSFLHNQYHSPDFAALKEFLNLKDWFCLMGTSALSTALRIENVKNELKKEMAQIK